MTFKILLISFENELMGIRYIGEILKKYKFNVEAYVDPVLFDDSLLIRSKLLSKIFNMDYLFEEKLMKFKPDLVAFSVVTDYYQKSLKLCGIVKKVSKKIKKDIKTIMGGIHATSVPNIIIIEKNVDYVCVGEGEFAILELCKSLEKKDDRLNIKNIWLKKNNLIIKNEVRPLEKNLDNLPIPYDNIYFKSYPPIKFFYGTITSRGCPYMCSYCNNYIYKKIIYKKDKIFYRRRSVGNVIEELKQRKNRKFIRFHDENFICDKKWLKEFAKKYKEKINLPYFCWVHPNSVDEEIVKLLKHSGCIAVQMGVQTIYEKTRENILNRYTKTKKIEECIRLFKRYNIEITVDNIFGLPNQSIKEMEDLVLFYLNNVPDRLFIYYLTYYPKLKINEISLKNNLINFKSIKNIEKGKGEMFIYGGCSINKNAFKLNFLVHLISFGLSKKIAYKIIKKKLYRFLPAISPKFNNFFYKGSVGNKILSKRRKERYFYFLKKKFIDIFKII